MDKPRNYEKVQASGEFVPIELGGHILEIKQVVEMKSKTGRPMLKVSFDFAKEDRQPGYFAEQYKNDIRPDKKWPNAGTAYILTEDQDGNCSRQFKTFTTSAERSSNFTIQWGDQFCNCFKGKKIGGVFGVVQNDYNGKVTNQHRLRWFRSMENVLDAEIPEPKLLPQGNTGIQQAPPVGPDGFMNIPDGVDEELPFD